MANLGLNNITSKLAQNAKTLGKLYGYLAPMAGTRPDPLQGIYDQHAGALSALLKGKTPKPHHIITAVQRHGMPILKNALMAYLLGEVGGGFIGGRNAKALKDFGVEAAKYAILSSAVICWEWNPHPPANIGRSSLGSENPMESVYA